MKSQAIGLMIVLLSLFITLKLGGKIDWPWIWVLSPIWLPQMILIGLIVSIAVASLFLPNESKK
jgi:ABC-type polysaccharide/polyol phosphate export permease